MFLSILKLVSSNNKAVIPKGYNVSDPAAPHTKAALWFHKRGNVAEALKSFRAAVDFKPTAKTTCNLGRALLLQGRVGEALSSLEYSLALDPTRVATLKVVKKLEEEWPSRKGYAIDVAGSFTTNVLSYRGGNTPLWQLAERPVLDSATSNRDHDILINSIKATDTSNHPPKQIYLPPGRQSFFKFISSEDFMGTYFENWPVVLHAKDALQNVLTYETFLSDTYGYGADKMQPPHRNVNYLQGSFVAKEEVRQGSLQRESELRQALRRGSTLLNTTMILYILRTRFLTPTVTCNCS